MQHPFERELGTFKDVRWLAVIDSNVALLEQGPVSNKNSSGVWLERGRSFPSAKARSFAP